MRFLWYGVALCVFCGMVLHCVGVLWHDDALFYPVMWIAVFGGVFFVSCCFCGVASCVV